ncbi:hypothetical protein DMUE_0790, partial [Dictyocoela muelleri]
LLPIINQICRPGSIIWSDEWRGYSNLLAQGYNHETVNHSYNFINPQNGVNTQTIESLWNKLKSRLKKLMGSSGNDVEEYLKEWMWKDNIGKKNFENVFDLIK